MAAQDLPGRSAGEWPLRRDEIVWLEATKATGKSTGNTGARYMRGTFQVHVLWLTVLCLGCEPEAIAPLPSPVEPDGTRILLSSLTAVETEDNEENRLVSVVGTPGAVNDVGAVEITNVRTNEMVSAVASTLGTFAGRAYGRPDDGLRLVYVNAEGRRSRATNITISEYSPASSLAATDASNQPTVPGAPPESSESTDAEPCAAEDEDCLAAGSDTPEGGEEIDWVASFSNGIVTLQGPIGFADQDSIVIVSNLNTGAVISANVNTDTGAVRVEIPAENGDVLLVFAQDSEDANLTSPAVEFLVAFD